MRLHHHQGGKGGTLCVIVSMCMQRSIENDSYIRHYEEGYQCHFEKKQLVDAPYNLVSYGQTLPGRFWPHETT